MAKVHFTHSDYKGHAACQWDPNSRWELTEDISKVDCCRCLGAITAPKPLLTLDELRKLAQQSSK